MSPQNFLLKSASHIWTNQHMQQRRVRQEIDLVLQKKLLNLLNVGESYYYIFNLQDLKFDFVSDEIIHVLGYAPDEFTMELGLSIIHLDDQPKFINFENTVMNFFKELPPEKYFKYKVRYDYRMRRKDGNYIRILQQVITINYSLDGGVIHTFGVHTDISHLKTSNHMSLSLIGLDGEPSFIDYPVEAYKENNQKKTASFTKRERDILSHIWEGKDNKQIGSDLNISPETVKTIRKNMMAKTGAKSTIALIRLALEHGAI
ncbi:MAG: PAS domain-containing protein [Crocinitomicaceae bacterium]|nr:PAS domain-containing protein [Crocinitomicaceae bacterium]MBK8926272.1 PAS domain-containing protein [Crocinitomicaceae bacterium]